MAKCTSWRSIPMHNSPSPFKFMLAPCIARFSEASGKKERLVVAFTDYSLGPNSLPGVGIMCHEFPLTKAGNKHKLDAEAQIMSLADIVELAEIDTKLPAYKDVQPCVEASFILRRASIDKTARSPVRVSDTDCWVLTFLQGETPLPTLYLSYNL